MVFILLHMTRTPQARASEQRNRSLGVRGWSQSNNYSGTGPRLFFLIYLFEFYNTFYHRVVQIPRHVDPPQNCENIFLIILMFQAITSIFHFFLEKSFVLLDWDW